MQFNRWVVTAAILAAYGTGSKAGAEDTTDPVKALKQQIEQLDQKVRILERKGELDKEASTEKAKTAASVSAGAGGFSIRSADTNFVLKLRGGFQTDSRFFPGDETPAKDTFLFRRVRPIVDDG